MQKYLQGRKLSDSTIKTMLELLQQWEAQLLYVAPMHRDQWAMRCADENDELSKELFKLLNSTKKYKLEVTRMIEAYGRRLYAR